MGNLLGREIVQTRIWIDPSAPSSSIDLDYKFTYPIVVFSSVKSDMTSNAYDLHHIIKIINEKIDQLQPMIPAGNPNELMTWTSTAGKIGRTLIKQSIGVTSDVRSADAMVSEKGIGAHLDTKVSVISFQSHTRDVSEDNLKPHITSRERDTWNSMTPLIDFIEHNKTRHVESSDRERWDSKVSTETLEHTVTMLKNEIEWLRANTYTREIIRELINDASPRFFNYKNIYWDYVSTPQRFELEPYRSENWDPELIYDYRYNHDYFDKNNCFLTRPNGTVYMVEDSFSYADWPDIPNRTAFAIVAKYPPLYESRLNWVQIYLKEPTTIWRKVVEVEVTPGDLFITPPVSTTLPSNLYLWISGRFVRIATTFDLMGNSVDGINLDNYLHKYNDTITVDAIDAPFV